MIAAKCLLIVSIVAGVTPKKLPSYIQPCHQQDPNLNECMRRAVTDLQPRLLNGLPELLIPSMNPLVIPQAGLNAGDFKASFKNIEIYYANEFVLKTIDVKLDQNRFAIGVEFPRLRIKSIYNIDGRLLVVQIKGTGPADGNFTDVTASVVVEGFRYVKRGKEYLGFKNKTLDLNVGKPVFLFDRIFQDNTELNDRTNQVINENIVDILDELKPVIYDTVSEIIFGTVSRIFNRFSLDDLFPK